MKPQVVIVEQVEESEQQLVDQYMEAENANWKKGEAAAKWTKRHAAGRTDKDFAVMVDSTQQVVQELRTTYETFADVYGTFRFLKWSHFAAAVSWDDAPEYLQQADESRLSVRDMVRLRKLHREPEKEEGEPEPEKPEPAPTRRAPKKPHAKEPEPVKVEEPKPEPAPKKIPGGNTFDTKLMDSIPADPPAVNVDAILTQLDASIGRIMELEQRRTVAAKFREWANQLDPPKSREASAEPRFKKPTVEKVAEHIREKGYTQVNAEEFVNFYESKGWKVGTTPMKSWQAAIANWDRRARAEKKQGANGGRIRIEGEDLSNWRTDEDLSGVHS